jgi:hypothetical protein
VPSPGGAVTVAVRATLAPNVAVAGRAVRVVVVAGGCTVTATAAEVEAVKEAVPA